MALSGMSAGVQTLQLSGKPNSDMATIRIRGVGTLNNSNPLVLVDGMELSLMILILMTLPLFPF